MTDPQQPDEEDGIVLPSVDLGLLDPELAEINEDWMMTRPQRDEDVAMTKRAAESHEQP